MITDHSNVGDSSGAASQAQWVSRLTRNVEVAGSSHRTLFPWARNFTLIA